MKETAKRNQKDENRRKKKMKKVEKKKKIRKIPKRKRGNKQRKENTKKSEEKKKRQIIQIICICNILTFDPAKNAIPRWCTGRKWHIRMASNRKRSHGWIKADNMGQGEGPIVSLQSDAPEESDLRTAWQLFPLDDD